MIRYLIAALLMIVLPFAVDAQSYYISGAGTNYPTSIATIGSTYTYTFVGIPSGAWWTVSMGTILSGQGSRSIVVRWDPTDNPDCNVGYITASEATTGQITDEKEVTLSYSIPGTVSPASQAVIAGQTPATLQATEPINPGGSYYDNPIHSWQYSTDGQNWNWTDIDGNSFTPAPVTQTTWYRASVSAAGCGGWAYTNTVVVNVNPPLPTPGNLTAVTSATRQITVQWIDNSSQEDQYDVYRSVGNNTNYQLLATIPANSTSYIDNAVGGNTTYYYKVKAVSSSTTSNFSNEGAATTGNTAPVINGIQEVLLNYGSGTVIPVSASDIDNETLTLTGINLPAFATFVDLGNGTGEIRVNAPGAAATGNYSITVQVTDAHGATAQVSFNLSVIGNHLPVIQPIANVTLDELTTQTINIAATDQESIQGSVWSFTGLPAFVRNIVIDAGNRQLVINPGAGAAGTYTVVLKVTDTDGGYDTKTFTITVLPEPLKPGTVTYIASQGLLSIAGVRGGTCNRDYSYQWLRADNPAGPFTEIYHATGANVMALASATTLYYQVRITCNGTTVYSNVATVPPYTPIVSAYNYIKTFDINKPGITYNDLFELPVRDGRERIQYLDGLGRVSQTVARKGSQATATAPVDLVSPVVYDDQGREVLKYLPFAANGAGGNTSLDDGQFKTNPIDQQSWFYSNNNPNSPVLGQGETVYNGKTDFEPSPLNRVYKAYAAGNNWVQAGNGVEQRTWVNTANDAVAIWKVIDNPTPGQFGSYNRVGIYGDGELIKKVTKDERGYQVIEYVNKDGLMILKKVQLDVSAEDLGYGMGHPNWLCTYYIYDDANLLRAVLQPKAVEYLDTHGWAFDANGKVLNELSFRYEYDLRRRMIVKQIPGAQPAYMVYDARDRLILKQDGNQRSTGKWLFTKYDALNRAIVTGLYTNSGVSGQAAMQQLVDNSNLALYENYRTGSFPLYSISNSFPQVAASDVLTFTYYDDYSWSTYYGNQFATKDNSWDGDITAINKPGNDYPYATPLTQTRSAKGLVTAVWDRTGPGLLTVNYYDDRERIIQTKHFNYTAGMDVATNQYSFGGQLLVSVQHVQKAGTNAQTHDIWTNISYDDQWRMAKTEKKVISTINNAAVTRDWTTISESQYNAIGQLKQKRLGAKPVGGGLVSQLDFEHNIRGWLLSINKDYLTSGGNDLYFGMQLGYDKDGVRPFANKQMNGNIAGQLWKSAGDQELRTYDYSYDPANRLLKADFTDNKGFDFDVTMGNGSNNPTDAYDANGNIKRMTQRGIKAGSNSVLLDDLIYNYTNNGDDLSNKLREVKDQSTVATSTLGDLNDKNNNGTDDYDYDGNGNLKFDRNKNISSITYNYLDLPQLISFKKDDNVTDKGTIEYIYDALGNKLKKVTIDKTDAQRVVTTTTLYMGGLVYESRQAVPADPDRPDYTDMLQYLPHEEGRIRFEKATQATCPSAPDRFVFDYFIKDHLGNTRSVVTEETRMDCYIPLSFDGSTSDIQQQNSQWEKADGTPINVTAVRNRWSSSFRNKYGGTPGDRNGEYGVVVKKSTGSAGPGKLLKVMAGDYIHTSVDYYYEAANANNSQADGIGTMVTSLLGALSGSPAAGIYKGQGADVTGFLGSSQDVIGFFTPQKPSNGSGEKPKAYLNILLFDDQFTLDQNNSLSIPVNGTAGDRGTIDKRFSNGVAIPKSGYVYVYCSNESDDDVYFDDFTLSHEHGPLLEETHYYPFGLTMAGISSRALNGIQENKRGFNGNELQNKEFCDGSGLETYDFNARMYDPQIGRFFQVDPLSDLSVSWSPYAFASDNPINRNDAGGLKDTTINGQTVQRDRDLATVTVTAKKKTLYAPQSPAGRFWRNHVNHIAKVPTQVTNVFELGANSLLRRNMVWLDGDLLDRVKQEPEMVRHQMRIVAIIKADPRFGKTNFWYSNTGEQLEFGGKRAAGEDWFGISDENPLLHSETWDVAVNPLTWTLRHAQIQTDAIIKEDGTITMSHYISDQLDLRPGPNHTDSYNKVTRVLGPIYHDFFRGNEFMQVRGNWTATITN